MSWGERFATGTRASLLSGYEEAMVEAMFEPWGRLLLDTIAPRAGDAILDIACGPGTVTRLAAARVGPRGRLVGCDLSPGMLAIAADKGQVPDGAPIEYLEASAEHLPIESGRFDAVVCQQGLQFFPDRPAALAEMRRALRAGGRLGVAVWGRIEQCPPFGAIADAVTEVLGEELGSRYRAGPWGMPSPDELHALLEAGGFADVQVESQTLPVVFVNGPAQLVATLAASGLAQEVAALDSHTRQRLEAAITRHAEPLTVASAIHSQLVSNIGVGLRE